jgi:hypothetical protein
MMEAEFMHVPQLAKRAVLTAAAACLVLTGCGDSGPDVPFNPAGTTGDLEAASSTFESSAFASFSTFSLMFDAALLPAGPVVSASAAALDIRATSKEGMQAAAVRTAQRLADLMRSSSKSGINASVAFVAAEVAGKTFVYSGGTYVMSDLPGAPANGVRFLLYAVDPVTFLPVEPLVETGHVDLIDLSTATTQAARVRVFSGGTEYINYTVSVTSSTSSGRISIVGYVSDGTHQANINLRATLTSTAGLTLTYSVDVPTRDFSIDLTLTSNGVDPTTATIGVTIDVRGGNGWVYMTGQFDQSGGTLHVSVNGDAFATITVVGAEPPVITRHDGSPLTDEDAAAVQGIFEITDGAFTSFDRLFLPVGAFLQPAA